MLAAYNACRWLLCGQSIKLNGRSHLLQATTGCWSERGCADQHSQQEAVWHAATRHSALRCKNGWMGCMKTYQLLHEARGSMCGCGFVFSCRQPVPRVLGAVVPTLNLVH